MTSFIINDSFTGAAWTESSEIDNTKGEYMETIVIGTCLADWTESSEIDNTKGEYMETIVIGTCLNEITKLCHDCAVAGGWWHDIDTGKRKERNKGELLMLIVSEIAEAMEGERKGAYDDHLPHRLSAEVELADALIRIFDYAGAHGYNLGAAMAEKLHYNAIRADHKPENRRKDGGKSF